MARLFCEHSSGLDFCAARPDQNDAAIILEVKRNYSITIVDSGPTGLGASAGLDAALLVSIGFGNGAGPMFRHGPLVIHAGGSGEVTLDGLAGHSAAFEFDQADEHAGGFAGGQVVDQAATVARPEGADQTHQRQNRANKRQNRGFVDHKFRVINWTEPGTLETRGGFCQVMFW